MEGSIPSVFSEGTVVLILFKTLCAVLTATKSAYFSSLYSSAGQLQSVIRWTSGLKGLRSLSLHALCFGISSVWWPLLGWLNSSISASVQVLGCAEWGTALQLQLHQHQCWLGNIIGQARVATSHWGCVQVVLSAATPQYVCMQKVHSTGPTGKEFCSICLAYAYLLGISSYFRIRRHIITCWQLMLTIALSLPSVASMRMTS